MSPLDCKDKVAESLESASQTEAREHSQKVTDLFSNIARFYDFLNRFFSLGIDALWRKKHAKSIESAALNSEAIILDLAAGTMEVTKELAKKYPQAKILAVDFCQPMLLKGRGKLKDKIGISVLPAVGDALKLPLADESVNAVTVAFGLRNFKPREKALKEVFRVLKPGGLISVLEFGSANDKIIFGLYNWYLVKILPLMGRLVSRDKSAYSYLAETIVAYPSAGVLVNEFKEQGFCEVSYTRHTWGIVCIHKGKKQLDILGAKNSQPE